jgi:hypothetical protein
MSNKQMVLTTASVMAVVVIVTLVKIGLGGRDDPKSNAGGTDLGAPHLNVRSPTGPNMPLYAEVGHEGHHDFYFTNDNDAPVDVSLNRVSCGKCVTMQIGLAPEGAQKAQDTPSGGTDVPNSLAEAMTKSPVAGGNVQWVPLEAEEAKHDAKSFTVPAKSAGWLRLAWHDKNSINEEDLGADLRTTSSVGKAPMFRVQVKVRFLDAVRPYQAKLNLDPIRSGSNKPQTAWFKVFSVTRDKFDLKPEKAEEQKKRNPFVTCGDPELLSKDECKSLAEESRLPVLCGYKVKVTVSETTDGRQHDLGPFTAGVVLKSRYRKSEELEYEELDDVALSVTGIVEGVVTVVCGETKDQITLGTFPRSTGTQTTATIMAVDAGTDVKLAVDSVPEFLKVQLTEEPRLKIGDRRKRWILSLSVVVKVLDDANVYGSLEEGFRDTAIYLKANDRRLRIPVTGTVQQR